MWFKDKWETWLKLLFYYLFRFRITKLKMNCVTLVKHWRELQLRIVDLPGLQAFILIKPFMSSLLLLANRLLKCSSSNRVWLPTERTSPQMMTMQISQVGRGDTTLRWSGLLAGQWPLFSVQGRLRTRNASRSIRNCSGTSWANATNVTAFTYSRKIILSMDAYKTALWQLSDLPQRCQHILYEDVSF